MRQLVLSKNNWNWRHKRCRGFQTFLTSCCISLQCINTVARQERTNSNWKQWCQPGNITH